MLMSMILHGLIEREQGEQKAKGGKWWDHFSLSLIEDGLRNPSLRSFLWAEVLRYLGVIVDGPHPQTEGHARVAGGLDDLGRGHGSAVSNDAGVADIENGRGGSSSARKMWLKLK